MPASSSTPALGSTRTLLVDEINEAREDSPKHKAWHKALLDWRSLGKLGYIMRYVGGRERLSLAVPVISYMGVTCTPRWFPMDIR
jgi:hypothetical protein